MAIVEVSVLEALGEGEEQAVGEEDGARLLPEGEEGEEDGARLLPEADFKTVVEVYHPHLT